MQIKEIKEKIGVADMCGVTREIGLQLLDNVNIGDYVLVHAGYAIEKVDEDEALETLELIKQLELPGMEPDTSSEQK